MTRLSGFKKAADRVSALRKLRRLRQAYGSEDSPPQRAIVSLDCDHGPEPVTLSAVTRPALCRALAHEEAILTDELRALGVTIDTDLPL
jgi:hypothetical protein